MKEKGKIRQIIVGSIEKRERKKDLTCVKTF
jgi:hypothetical protein